MTEEPVFVASALKYACTSRARRTDADIPGLSHARMGTADSLWYGDSHKLCSSALTTFLQAGSAVLEAVGIVSHVYAPLPWSRRVRA